nr:hypothetical protein AH6.9 - Caenorhabditis elegans [Caenorhabditis elegans]
MSHETCELLQTEAHCAPYLQVLLGSTSGIIYGQTGLMVERTCATFLNSYKKRKSKIIGFSIALVVFICSVCTGTFLMWNDPLDGAVLGCFMFPKQSAANSVVYFSVCTFLILFNFAISILLKIYNKKFEFSTRYEITARFRKREAIDSTGTVCFLAFSLFVLMLIYSIGVSVLRHLLHTHALESKDFYFYIVWIYTVPFIAMLLPLLLIYRIRVAHVNRVQLLIGCTLEKQSQESHINQMKNMWK